jgi:hypothetical protein
VNLKSFWLIHHKSFLKSITLHEATTMNEKKILKTYIKSVLRENAIAVSNDELAAFISDDYGEDEEGIISAIIYHPMAILENLETLVSMTNYVEISNWLANNCVKGFIEILESAKDAGLGPCYDSAVVNRSAGPGYGKVVYGVGYALSPSGKLAPDRENVSNKAKESWGKAFASSRERVQLDDFIHDHGEPGNEYHTDDPP